MLEVVVETENLERRVRVSADVAAGPGRHIRSDGDRFPADTRPADFLRTCSGLPLAHRTWRKPGEQPRRQALRASTADVWDAADSRTTGGS